MNSKQQLDALNWELFVSELNMYLMMTQSFLLTNDSIEMTEIIPEIYDKTYILNNSENHVRLTTPINGTIIMLPYSKIKSIQQEKYAFQLKIEQKSGKVKERTFVVPLR